jgi:hypothetical protein
MTQGELAFKYEEDRQGEGMTGMAGIGTYLDLACRSGLVGFVPDAIGNSKNGPESRYLVIREPMQDQLILPGMDQDEKEDLAGGTLPSGDFGENAAW